MVHVAVVDDEEEVLQILCQQMKETLQALGLHADVVSFTSGVDLLKAGEHQDFHIVFLDLEMPDMDGLEVARQLRLSNPNLILLFVTNRDDLVFRAFQYNVSAFIRKKYLKTELPEALIAAYRRVVSREKEYLFRTAEGSLSVPVSHIRYFVSQGHTVYLYEDNGQKSQVRYTLEKIEDMVPSELFIRCHSGFLVNCMFIFSVNADTIELKTHDTIPVSRHRRKSVKQAFQSYLRSI